MIGLSQIELAGQLRQRWRRWTQLIHRVASQQRGRATLAPHQYDLLHAELLQLSRVLASRNDAEPVFQEIEGVLIPWTQYDSLMWADRDIIWQLLDRCRAVQWVLDGRPGRHRSWRPACIVLTVVLAMSAVAMLSSWAIGEFVQLFPAAPRWIRPATQLVSRRGPEGRFLILGAVMTLFAVVFVWRSARRS